MKLRSTLLLSLIAFASVEAQFLQHGRKAFRAAPPSSAYEGFEGTGAPSLWTDASTGNTVNFDYTTSPLAGAQSLFLADTVTNDRYTYYNFPQAADQIWFAFRFRTTGDPGAEIEIAGLEDSGGVSLASMRLFTNGNLLVRVQGANSASVQDLAANTEYRIKARYVRGTGSNETLQVWCNDNSAGAWSSTQTQSNGTSTNQADRSYFYTNQSSNRDFTIDNVLVSTSDIPWSDLN